MGSWRERRGETCTEMLPLCLSRLLNDHPGGHSLLPRQRSRGALTPRAKQVAVCGTSALVLGSASSDAVLRAFMRVLSSLPFPFSSSLSQFSEENMMDPYNLAICFGPSLMSVPEGHDQVSCQTHVNELIKTIIIQHEHVFPNPRELEGPIYSRGGSTEDYW